jgi:hypothetical protein
MNWLPNDSSIEGTSSLGGSGVCPKKMLKIKTLEMPFSAIWALNYELQFDFSLTAIFLNLIFCTSLAPLLHKANRGAHARLCTPPPPINPTLLYSALSEKYEIETSFSYLLRNILK